MGGRTMPTECRHGHTDWGDGDECPDCWSAGKATITVEWGKHSDVPEGVIHSTIDIAVEHLMAQLLCMGVTDPYIDMEDVRWEPAGPPGGENP